MTFKAVASACALGLGLVLATAADAQKDSAAQKLSPEAIAFEKGLHKQSGDVAIPAAHAVLHLGERYYFVPADEAKTILTKVWGNPPSSGDGVLGIVFEKGRTIYDNVWGAIVTYEDTGYVPDKDAKTEDYDKVVESIRAGEADANAERTKGGYPTIHLVGWAQQPSYDPAAHSLIWARDIKFSDSPVDALNYDVRLLGRKGVLSLNMLSDMKHLPDVRAAATDFGKAAAFTPGATYADYDKSVDKTAEFGLAGLVAAGAGVVVAKKLGLLAIVFGFWKVILGGLAVAGAAISRFFGKIFGRKRDTLEGDEGSL
ncbi:DUF2167 domain-containing protein [Sphingomonas sp. DC1600-2]|uniref:DUF2167 domain-containing protein n=1 Tax=unclassified Sphingomonas TaxID=196159 RepID=UPI003CEE049B